jgi:hypothetical protein
VPRCLHGESIHACGQCDADGGPLTGGAQDFGISYIYIYIYVVGKMVVKHY